MAAEVLPRFCVLGGGVSGLTSAFLLQRSFPHAHVVLVEASQRLGGLVKSTRGAKRQLLEQGFHSSVLVDKNGREALGLAKLLKLEEDVVGANIEASARRHLFHHGRVQLVPRAHHILQHGPALMAEPLWPRGKQDDESVHSFISRRASRSIADRLADPICRGQLAGDAKTLSVRTCFPRLWFNEQRFGSVFMGAALSTILAYQRRSWLSLELLDPLLQRVATGGRCYSFRQGMSSLVEALEERLLQPPPGTRPAEILLQASGTSEREAATVQLSDGRSLEADVVLAAIPPPALAKLLERSCLDVAADSPDAGEETSICKLLNSVKHESVAVVNVSFEEDVLKERRLRGAGYFVGSLEDQGPLLGMSWDSQLFPDHARSGGSVGTQLSVYLQHADHQGSGEDSAVAAARDAVRRHLGVEAEPSELAATLWHEAVPQYAVGHHSLMQAVNAARLRQLPWLQVAGPGYYGTRSVADEIIDARELVDSLSHRFARFPGLVENETDEDVLSRLHGGFPVK
eukprot:TRINITY_DN34105_c0_g1_i1.p1 TRINITY_DN34105_c0_g1~~TRINITY_DN34105_c0_g1_i1.p1  ORF type:complete len:525 (+),score=101.15 TRINITY_DN34105_c0_g1_i1:29-1576(+)